MNPVLLSLFFCALAASAAAAPASKPQTTTAPDGQRFLFIVDTSSSMDRLRTATETTLHNLISSGIGRQMWPGDTYGLWTFSKETSTKFPMQVWDSRNSSQLGTVVAAYLSEQPYEKSSNLKQMVAALSVVVQSVSNLNVLILSDGSSPMAGTPFDTEINAHYKTRRKERREAKMPFITTFVVRDGWIISGSVVIAGEGIEFPPRALPEIAQKKPSPPPRPRPTVPPPQSTPAIAAQSTVSQAAAPNPRTADAPNAFVSAPAPAPENPPAAPRPRVMQIATRSNVVATTSAAQAFPTEPTNSPLVVATATPSNTVSATPPAIEPAASTAAGVEGGSDPIATASASTVMASRPLENALAALLPAPVPVAARERSPSPVSPEASSTASLQGVAMPIPPEWSGSLMLAFGGFLLGAAAFLVIVVMRRPRPISQGSLITQSMDRR